MSIGLAPVTPVTPSASSNVADPVGFVVSRWPMVVEALLRDEQRVVPSGSQHLIQTGGDLRHYLWIAILATHRDEDVRWRSDDRNVDFLPLHAHVLSKSSAIFR